MVENVGKSGRLLFRYEGRKSASEGESCDNRAFYIARDLCKTTLEPSGPSAS